MEYSSREGARGIKKKKKKKKNLHGTQLPSQEGVQKTVKGFGTKTDDPAGGGLTEEKFIRQNTEGWGGARPFSWGAMLQKGERGVYAT